MIHVRIQETKIMLTPCFAVQHHHYETPQLPCKELRRKAQGSTAGAESTELWRGGKEHILSDPNQLWLQIIILAVFKELTKV